MQSIKEVSDQLEADLKQYLESSYHLHHPRLLKERRELLKEGKISTEPWVEATPSYVSGRKFRDLNLPTNVVDMLKDLEEDGLDIFDPPYKHQADALEAFFDDEKDLIVSTGTGSGKTEIFLYSILGKLAEEAERNISQDQRGMRTLILYPMNALVADQLSRMRLLFGDEDGADTIEDYMGRRVQFGMYTSRTPYHGEFDTDKNDQRIKPVIQRYLHLKREKPELYNELMDKGRIPAKNLEGFRNRNALKTNQYQTQPGDRELFTRQEMHSAGEDDYGGTPDILITNYSMLEYMLLRPIEQPLFEDTREWLEEDEDNELTIVLDEAHLYRGAQGAEVALLMSRLLQNLQISRDRVRFILTSATMGENIETAAPDFAAQLTIGSPDEFAVITGEQKTYEPGEPSDQRTAEILSRIEYEIDDAKIRNLAIERDWTLPDKSETDSTRKYLANKLETDPLFRLAHDHLQEEPIPLEDLAAQLFDGIDADLAQEATGNLLYLCTEAQRNENQALLPTRLHMFLKGLPAQYACVNPVCEGRRVTEGEDLLGRIYTTPHTTCPECGSRVFELLSHRTCGAAYLQAYRRSEDNHGPTFLWTDPEDTNDLDELHLLVEEPRSDEDPKHEQNRPLSETTKSRHLDISSGHLVNDQRAQESNNEHIEVWLPTEEPPEEDYPWSWTRCPACGIEERWWKGETKIQDLETKGEEPFANIVRSMFGIQPEDTRKAELPNKGKKVLTFSDGRQKAARLARDVQKNVELDSFREVATGIISNTPDEISMSRFFAKFAVYYRKNNILFFDDSDEHITQEGVQYPGSRTRFQDIQEILPKLY
ncbi:MAG: DEAD/DEAH box helicase [Halodesulfurarchaeum sp.]